MLCVSVFGRGWGGEVSPEGILYLYNLSNSPMLISEGHPQYIWITMLLCCLLLAALAPVEMCV